MWMALMYELVYHVCIIWMKICRMSPLAHNLFMTWVESFSSLAECIPG